MVSAILSRLVILVFGTLYPAYASYKAVRTKNVKEYVKWMMYWIVFALFCTVETFSDFFLSWFPFYYEFKIIFVLWMLSPITQGSSFLFKKFVHPQLARREKDIDEMIEQATKQGYSAFVDLGNKGIKVILKSVIMGQSKLADHLRRSYSTSDLSNDGHDIVQRHEPIGDQEDREEELDNRLIEDQEELDRRATSVTKSKSSSSALSLSSVKEEDGEDTDHATTETFTIPSSTRRHYSVREDKTATRQLRCQSLPPFADRYSKPLIIASTNLESKRQFFTKFQSLEKKENNASNTPPLQVSPELDSKRRVLTRSHSQDSGTTNMLNTISSFAHRSGQKIGKAGVARTTADNKEEVTAVEKTLSKTDSVIKTDSQSLLLKEVSSQLNNEANEIKLDQSIGIDIEEYTDEEIRFMRRSLPRFLNELPAIDEAGPLELAPQSAVKDRPGNLSQYASSTRNKEDSIPLQDHGDSTGDPRMSLLSTDILGEDLSSLIFLNVEDDFDDQCSTPVAKDSPSNLSLDDEIKDTTTEKDSDNESLRDSDSIYTDDDASSVGDFKSLDQTDNDYESFSEAGSSVNWDTFSEASVSDLSECHDEDIEETPTLQDVTSSWSAPSSPASFIRGSKYEESTLQSWRSPASLLMYQRSKDKDEASWTKSRVQRQSSLPSTASRNILHSWPSPSQLPDLTSSRTTSSSRTRDKVSAKSYGQSFDPFKTWHPPSRSGATSYRSQSFDSPSTAYLQSKPFSVLERSHYPYTRSASADLAGDKTD